MARTLSRGARLTSLALATGTLVVAANGSAGAATVSIPQVYGGYAKAAAIHLEINLPIALPLPGVPAGPVTSLIQDISFVEGNTAQGGLSPVAITKAVLGNGNIVLVSDLLNKTTGANLGGKQDDANGIIAPTDVLGGLIHVGVGAVTSHVSPNGLASTLTSASTSKLVDLKVSLGNLDLTGQGKTNVNDLLNQVTGALGGATNTATGVLGNAVDTLNGITGQDAPTAAVLATVTDTVSGLQSTLTGLLNQLKTTGNILDLGVLAADHTVTRNGAAVSAAANSSVANLDVLGGLVHLDAVKSAVKAVAGGVPGSASSTIEPTLLGLSVKDLLTLKLDQNGLSGQILGNTLPAAAQDAVSQALAAVNQVLKVAGVEISYGKSTKTAAADGRSASASTEGVGITVNPLHATKPLVFVQLVPASAAVNAAVIPAVAPRNPTTTPTNTVLAHTGMSATTGGIAVALIVLAGLGLAARRRFGHGEL